MISQMMGPSFVYKTFYDVGLNNVPDELHALAQKAYRAAFKVALGNFLAMHFQSLKLRYICIMKLNYLQIDTLSTITTVQTY